jgi:hypothetical protein
MQIEISRMWEAMMMWGCAKSFGNEYQSCATSFENEFVFLSFVSFLVHSFSALSLFWCCVENFEVCGVSLPFRDKKKGKVLFC